MPLAGFALSHLAFAACFAALSVALGRRLAALVCPAVDWPGEGGRWGLPLALGVGAIGCLASLLGAAGLLTRPSLLLLAGAAALAAAPEWRPLLGDAWALAAGPRRVWLPCAVVAALPSLALALYPPTGFDALLYHLPAAGRFAASGRIALAPELRFPAFPWLNEVLFAAALRLQDDVAAQLVECVVHLGTAGLLWEWGRRRFGAWVGGLAAALWLGSPLATWLAASAYVEPLVALFLLAAAAALDLAERAHDSRALLLAGGLAGCAAATKYQGLLAVAMVAIWSWLGAPAGRRLRALLPPLLAAGAVALPWYAWIALATGDPLFPVLTRMGHAPASGLHVASRMAGAVTLPWRAVIDRGPLPYPPGSPFLWWLWPLPLLAWRRAPHRRPSRRLAVTGLAVRGGPGHPPGAGPGRRGGPRELSPPAAAGLRRAVVAQRHCRPARCRLRHVGREPPLLRGRQLPRRLVRTGPVRRCPRPGRPAGGAASLSRRAWGRSPAHPADAVAARRLALRHWPPRALLSPRIPRRRGGRAGTAAPAPRPRHRRRRRRAAAMTTRAMRRWVRWRRRLASARETLVFRRSFLLSWLVWPVAYPAAWIWRRTWLRSTRVVAVTGSFGKTSTAAAAAAAAGVTFAADRANYGSFLAAAVLRHRPRRLPLVLEVAISRRGQMRGYARLLRPALVVLTAVGAEHLGRLGSIAAIAAEKARLAEGLRPSGLLIVNGDDERCRAIGAARPAGRALRVGFAADCELRIEQASGDWPRGTRLRLAGPDGSLEIASRWIGRDLARCAALGVAVGLAAGVAPEIVGARLADVPPMPWRLEPVPLPGGAWLLCDAWKSTWPTVQAALGELGRLAGWRRVALLGDVEELLGPKMAAYLEYGRLAAAAAHRILYVGTEAGFVRLEEGVRRAGTAAPRATAVELYRDWRQAAEALRAELTPGTAILVKGRQRQKLGRVAILLRGGAVRCSLRVCPARGLRCELCPRLG